MNYQDKVGAIQELLKTKERFDTEWDKIGTIFPSYFETDIFVATGYVLDLTLDLTAKVIGLTVDELTWFVFDCDKEVGSLCVTPEGEELLVKNTEEFLYSCGVVP